jgi:VanZ family protein
VPSDRDTPSRTSSPAASEPEERRPAAPKLELPTPKQVVWAWLPSVLYMAAIWALSSFSFQTSAIDAFPLRDKGVHFLEYAALGFLLAHASLRTWPRHSLPRVAAVGVLIAVGWGVLDELHQALVPGRNADVADLLADCAGAVAGAALRTGLRWARSAARKTPSSSGTLAGRRPLE